MLQRAAYLLVGLLLVAAASSAVAQEVLPPSRIQAKAVRRQPELGLPIRMDGRSDPAVWYDTGVWKGADSLKAKPFWAMSAVSEAAERGAFTPVLKLCAEWAAEKPQHAVDIVVGPFRGGWFVAICKKTRTDLTWKSIGFVIPSGGMLAGKRIWDYSHSVNWIEHHIGYNLFPKLPSHLQEIIEEMTSYELLCPFQEYDPGLDEAPDREVDYDMEADYREM